MKACYHLVIDTPWDSHIYHLIPILRNEIKQGSSFIAVTIAFKEETKLIGLILAMWFLSTSLIKCFVCRLKRYIRRTNSYHNYTTSTFTKHVKKLNREAYLDLLLWIKLLSQARKLSRTHIDVLSCMAQTDMRCCKNY